MKNKSDEDDRGTFDEYKHMCNANRLNKNEDEYAELDLHEV